MSSQQFNVRLQYLVDAKKISQTDLAKELGFAEARISTWLGGKVQSPRRTTLQKISEFFGCDIEWLASGEGEPWPNGNKVAHKMPSIRTENQQETDMKSFKELCASNFDVIFEFIADEYGMDPAGIEDFKDDFKNRFSEYQAWREKKRASRDCEDRDGPELQEVNGNDQ